jgi:hypothetical protein
VKYTHRAWCLVKIEILNFGQIGTLLPNPAIFQACCWKIDCQIPISGHVIA